MAAFLSPRTKATLSKICGNTRGADNWDLILLCIDQGFIRPASHRPPNASPHACSLPARRRRQVQPFRSRQGQAPSACERYHPACRSGMPRSDFRRPLSAAGGRPAREAGGRADREKTRCNASQRDRSHPVRPQVLAPQRRSRLQLFRSGDGEFYFDELHRIAKVSPGDSPRSSAMSVRHANKWLLHSASRHGNKALRNVCQLIAELSGAMEKDPEGRCLLPIRPSLDSADEEREHRPRVTCMARAMRRALTMATGWRIVPMPICRRSCGRGGAMAHSFNTRSSRWRGRARSSGC